MPFVQFMEYTFKINLGRYLPEMCPFISMSVRPPICPLIHTPSIHPSKTHPVIQAYIQPSIHHPFNKPICHPLIHHHPSFYLYSVLRTRYFPLSTKNPLIVKKMLTFALSRPHTCLYLQIIGGKLKSELNTK